MFHPTALLMSFKTNLIDPSLFDMFRQSIFFFFWYLYFFCATSIKIIFLICTERGDLTS